MIGSVLFTASFKHRFVSSIEIRWKDASIPAHTAPHCTKQQCTLTYSNCYSSPQYSIYRGAALRGVKSSGSSLYCTAHNIATQYWKGLWCHRLFVNQTTDNWRIGEFHRNHHTSILYSAVYTVVYRADSVNTIKSLQCTEHRISITICCLYSVVICNT